MGEEFFGGCDIGLGFHHPRKAVEPRIDRSYPTDVYYFRPFSESIPKVEDPAFGDGRHSEASVAEFCQTDIVSSHALILVELLRGATRGHDNPASVIAVDLRHHFPEDRTVGGGIADSLISYVEMDHLMDNHVFPLFSGEVEIETQTHLEVRADALSEAGGMGVAEFSAESAGVCEPERGDG